MARSMRLYIISLLPQVLAIYLISYNDKFRNLFDDKKILYYTTLTVGLTIGFLLAYWKWAARKNPVNLITYLIYTVLACFWQAGFALYNGYNYGQIMGSCELLSVIGMYLYFESRPSEYNCFKAMIPQGIFWLIGFISILIWKKEDLVYLTIFALISYSCGIVDIFGGKRLV